MAKLYWRVKLNGKWTWRPAVDVGKDEAGFTCVIPLEEIDPSEDYCRALEEEE